MKTSTTRVQLEMPEKSFERLKSLKDITEASSYSEVIKRSLQLYEGLILEVQNGNEVVIKSKTGKDVSYKLVF